MTLQLRELSSGDDCGRLSLGDPSLVPLKNFLKKEAKSLHQTNLAKTHVVVEEGERKVLAYVTTLCTQISVEDIHQHAPIHAYKYSDYPALKLARLAVDSKFRQRNLGSQLVDFVIGLTKMHIMSHTGCRFLLVDAKHQSIGFYLKKGFKK
jgi:GNAT superfamily N-acetyltransferase